MHNRLDTETYIEYRAGRRPAMNTGNPSADDDDHGQTEDPLAVETQIPSYSSLSTKCAEVSFRQRLLSCGPRHATLFPAVKFHSAGTECCSRQELYPQLYSSTQTTGMHVHQKPQNILLTLGSNANS